MYYSFASDYLEGAHPKILEAFAETNLLQTPGYGLDPFCDRAKDKIRKACECPDADVFFISGGTQTNQLVIDSLLDSYEAVLCCETGHVNGHEAGAIEMAGHKVLTLPEHDGKLSADEVRAFCDRFYADANHDHMVFPGLVYISYPTECGTLYSKQELEALHAVCRDYKMTLYADGARLGYGLMSPACDLTLCEFAALCDVFYIGGTKVGALFGEAIVFSGMAAPAHFFTQIKQHGALLAKGRALGIQFDVLFTDGLYFEISRHAMEMAADLKAVLRKKGLPFYFDSPTNQQFVIVENEKLGALAEQVGYGFWCAYDDTHSVIRFATSWATKPESLDYLESIL